MTHSFLLLVLLLSLMAGNSQRARRAAFLLLDSLVHVWLRTAVFAARPSSTPLRGEGSLLLLQQEETLPVAW